GVLLEFRVFHVFFFFSSRRRHTRCYRDWSSDVCSSDLYVAFVANSRSDNVAAVDLKQLRMVASLRVPRPIEVKARPASHEIWARSEERRVGKECRCRGAREG